MNYSQDAVQEAIRRAGSPEGQQLMKLLQQHSAQDLNQAMAKAAAGDYSGAKALLGTFLQNPQARRLLEQMGGINGSNGK